MSVLLLYRQDINTAICIEDVASDVLYTSTRVEIDSGAAGVLTSPQEKGYSSAEDKIT